MERLPGPPKGRRFERLFDVQRVATAALVLLLVSAGAVWGINHLLGPAQAPAARPSASDAAEAPSASGALATGTVASGTNEFVGPVADAAHKSDRAPSVDGRRPTAPPTIDRVTPPPAIAAAPAAAPANSARPAPPPAGVRGAAERVEVTASPPDAAIYSSRDTDVTPPVILWPQQLGRIPTLGEDQTLIEVVVNPDGSVAQVKARESPRTLDESMVMTMSLSAAKSWIFRPAYKDGRPVRYRQLVPVSVR